MHAMFSDAHGRRREGIVLAVSRYRLRVMFQGDSDAVEFNQQFGQWIGESGDPVELDGLVLPPSLSVSTLCDESLSHAFAAGDAPASD